MCAVQAQCRRSPAGAAGEAGPPFHSFPGPFGAGGSLSQAHKTKEVMVALLKALQTKLRGEGQKKLRYLLRGLRGKMRGQTFAVGMYGQKPILGPPSPSVPPVPSLSLASCLPCWQE